MKQVDQKVKWNKSTEPEMPRIIILILNLK